MEYVTLQRDRWLGNCSVRNNRPNRGIAMTPYAVKRSLNMALMAIAAFVLAASASRGQDRGQDYPNKVIRIVVPFAAGGAVDAVARTMARYFVERLGQQVFVENRPGAS